MKSSSSLNKHRVSPTPPVKQVRSPVVGAKPQNQKFNLAIQQRLKQKITEKQQNQHHQSHSEPTHHSTQSANSSHASRERHFFLDQRLRNFHKVLTESLQRHSFLSATRSTYTSGQPKLDQRQSLAKLFGDTQNKQLYQNKRKEKPRQSMKEQESLPRQQMISVTSHSTNNFRDLTPSPKQEIKRKEPSQLFTQISSLLQSAHSGQRLLDPSPPNSASKRIVPDYAALYQSHKMISNSQGIMSQFNSLQKANEADPSSQLSTLYQRVQQHFQIHERERRQWKQEREALANRLLQAEEEIRALRQTTTLSPILVEESTTVKEEELKDTNNPINFHEQSFG